MRLDSAMGQIQQAARTVGAGFAELGAKIGGIAEKVQTAISGIFEKKATENTPDQMKFHKGNSEVPSNPRVDTAAGKAGVAHPKSEAQASDMPSQSAVNATKLLAEFSHGSIDEKRAEGLVQTPGAFLFRNNPDTKMMSDSSGAPTRYINIITVNVKGTLVHHQFNLRGDGSVNVSGGGQTQTFPNMKAFLNAYGASETGGVSKATIANAKPQMSTPAAHATPHAQQPVAANPVRMDAVRGPSSDQREQFRVNKEAVDAALHKGVSASTPKNELDKLFDGKVNAALIRSTSDGVKNQYSLVIRGKDGEYKAAKFELLEDGKVKQISPRGEDKEGLNEFLEGLGIQDLVRPPGDHEVRTAR